MNKHAFYQFYRTISVKPRCHRSQHPAKTTGLRPAHLPSRKDTGTVWRAVPGGERQMGGPSQSISSPNGDPRRRAQGAGAGIGRLSATSCCLIKSDRKSCHLLFVQLDFANLLHFQCRSRCTVKYHLRFALRNIDGSNLILQ